VDAVAFIKSYTLPSGRRRHRVFWKDPAGKQHGKVFKRHADAKSFAREVEHSLDRGTYSDPARGKISLGAFWEIFIAATPGEAEDMPVWDKDQCEYLATQWRPDPASALVIGVGNVAADPSNTGPPTPSEVALGVVPGTSETYVDSGLVTSTEDRRPRIG
jgi:hypothetical protein